MRRPGRRARRVIAGAVTVAVVGVGYAAYAASADDTSYRTATATVGDVEQTLDLSGAVEPAGRADLSFATSGDIDDIAVEAGDKVKAGEVLGTLDDTGLRKSLQRARATLASARAQLETDENTQADTVSSSSTSATPSSTGSGAGNQDTGGTDESPTKSPTGDSDDALAELAAQQRGGHLRAVHGQRLAERRARGADGAAGGVCGGVHDRPQRYRRPDRGRDGRPDGRRRDRPGLH